MVKSPFNVKFGATSYVLRFTKFRFVTILGFRLLITDYSPEMKQYRDPRFHDCTPS